MESATKSCQLGVELTIKMGFFELLIEVGGGVKHGRKLFICKTYSTLFLKFGVKTSCRSELY